MPWLDLRKGGKERGTSGVSGLFCCVGGGEGHRWGLGAWGGLQSALQKGTGGCRVAPSTPAGSPLLQTPRGDSSSPAIGGLESSPGFGVERDKSSSCLLHDGTGSMLKAKAGPTPGPHRGHGRCGAAGVVHGSGSSLVQNSWAEGKMCVGSGVTAPGAATPQHVLRQ